MTIPEPREPDEPSRFLNTRDLAQLLGVPTSTIRYWRLNGQAPPSVKLGRHILFERKQVEAWLQEQAS